MEKIEFNELCDAYMFMQDKPFNELYKLWLCEVTLKIKAYDFIRKNGLWEEFIKIKHL